MTHLASDLSDLISKYGNQLAAAAEKKLVPLFRPGTDPLPDLSEIEQLRTSRHPACVRTNKFKFFPAQVERIAGTVATLKAQRTAWMICEMATGKSAMSLAVAWLKLQHKPNYRLLVMCPGHLVRKWKRETEWLLPNVDCRIISNFADLKTFRNEAARTHKPMVAVLGKDTAKLGIETDHPAAAGRKTRIYECSEYQTIELAVCPKCGSLLQVKENDEDRYVLLDEYLQSDKPVRCKECGDKCATAYCPKNRHAKPHLDRYIQRHMKGVFDLGIFDEVHELAAANSAQGNAFGTLASACKYVIALTGTLIGGKASDLHAPLWRMAPQLMLQRGFSLKHKEGAISRNERTFIRKYGVMEQRFGKHMRMMEHPKAGISPDLFNHFLISNAVFMSLSELGPALPSLERQLVPVPLEGELANAYKHIDQTFKLAMCNPRFKGKGPPSLAMLRVMVLDAFLDKPYAWEPVTAPVFDQDGNKIGRDVVVVPSCLPLNHEDAKDKKLLEIIQAELNAGRRCCIYPQFTGKHDVRPKLLVMLQRNGIRAMILPDSIKPIDRETWLTNNVPDVLICHPKRVQTGLDLLQYPTLVWYGLGYSTHTLRQASARARRPTQQFPCKVIYLYYERSVQENCMALMGTKEAASQMLEGTFDMNNLRALMNGNGDDDDILAALANNLESIKPAKAAWEQVKDITETEHGGLFVFDLETVEEEVIFYEPLLPQKSS